MKYSPITVFFFFGLAVSAFAATPPPEETPITLPGSEPLAYRTVGGVSVRLHVFKPAGWKAGDQRPALIDFFGGGWTHGTPKQSAGWGKWAAELGMVGIAPDYRVKNRFGTSPLEAVSDGRAALRWVEDNAERLGIDQQKIVVMGSSAGGHLALWTAIAHTPPGSDPELAPVIKPVALILLSAVSDTSVASGYAPSRFGKNTTALSPIDQLDAQMPPMLIFHGDADTTVPERQSFALRDKLKATGNSVEFVNVPGGIHSFTGMPGWGDKTKARVKTFLEEQKVIPVSARE